MNPSDAHYLKEHIQSLSEDQLWALLTDFFRYLEISAATTHAISEHGIDLIAYVNQEKDIIGRGYNILIQAKKGNLTLDKWRKNILYQLLETPYYRLSHPNYINNLSRRVLLVVSGKITPEARESITEFNVKHEITIDIWEMEDMLIQFDKTEFAKLLLETIRGVGEVEQIRQLPPVLGE